MEKLRGPDVQTAHALLGTSTPLFHMLRDLLESDGLVLASALAHSRFDRMARAAGARRCIRFRPRLDPRVDDFGPHGREGASPSLLSTQLDGVDIDLHRRHASAYPGHHAADILQCRRLDGLFGSHVSARQRVDVIVIDEHSERTLDILRGSDRVMRTDRPIVVFPLHRDACGAETLQLLADWGYVPYDDQLHPVDIATPTSQSTWVMALHGSEATAALSRAARSLDASRLSQRECADAAGSSAPSADLVLTLDDDIARWGFDRVPSSSGSDVWRIAARGHAGLVLPTLAAPLAKVSIELAAPAASADDTALRVSIDGVPRQATSRSVDGRLLLEYVLHSRREAWRASHLLEFSCPSQRRATTALAFQSISLNAWQG